MMIWPRPTMGSWGRYASPLAVRSALALLRSPSCGGPAAQRSRVLHGGFCQRIFPAASRGMIAEKVGVIFIDPIEESIIGRETIKAIFK
jgi:hypothetical protein